MAARVTKKVVDILNKQYPADDWTNITPQIADLTRRHIYKQRDSPLFLISERIRHFFKDRVSGKSGYSYDEHEFDSPVVTTEANFDSLLISKDHVSRKKSDTYYVNSDLLLRSHTSAHQSQCLNKGSKAFITIADCYRRDEIDRTHFPVFHQCEVFKLFDHKEILGNNSTPSDIYDSTNVETKTKQSVYGQASSTFVEQHMKSSIEGFVKHFFDQPDLQMRWVDAYFPFTHPSYELEIFWRDKWLELLGCGVVQDKILENAGIRDHVGFAAGFGLERFGMLKYKIPDIRLFWSRDSGFTHQFEGKSPFDKIEFKQFSSCPQCINDLSFWLPPESAYESNDFYDLCRTVGGDLIEQVKLIDDFKHPKTGRVSHCYRVVYRAVDRVLTKAEVNVIHDKIAQACKDEFGVELRT